MNDRMESAPGPHVEPYRRCPALAGTHRAARLATASFLFAACSAIAHPAPAQATPVSSAGPTGHGELSLTYEVHAGGLHAFSFDVNLIASPQGYRLSLAGGTRGMTSLLYKWDVALTAEGHQLRPARYHVVSSGRDPAKITQVDFIKGGAFQVTRNPSEPEDGDDGESGLPDKLPLDIVDPLSATLVASENIMANGRCEQAIPIFDGKRRFNILVDDIGQGQVPASRISVYQGPAMICGLTMQRISGFKQKRRYAKQWDEERDDPPRLWLARVRPDLPPVPVRFTGSVAFGAIVVHLTRIEARPEIASAASP